MRTIDRREPGTQSGPFFRSAGTAMADSFGFLCGWRQLYTFLYVACWENTPPPRNPARIPLNCYPCHPPPGDQWLAGVSSVSIAVANGSRKSNSSSIRVAKDCGAELALRDCRLAPVSPAASGQEVSLFFRRKALHCDCLASLCFISVPNSGLSREHGVPRCWKVERQAFSSLKKPLHGIALQHLIEHLPFGLRFIQQPGANRGRHIPDILFRHSTASM